MAYRHAAGYRRLEQCQLIACADVVLENARQFGNYWNLRSELVFGDTEEMLDVVQPDIVSICVPPHVHADVVLTCATHGAPDAIHCEKPMAKTWAECREMVGACEQAGVQLTFNHQRRFGRPFRAAKQLCDDGQIGTLQRIELGGKNLYDYGSHMFDLAGYITEQQPVEWVLAGIDYSTENIQFGAHNENRAIAQWRYENGVTGLAATGEESAVRCQLRLLGDEGLIEVGGSEAPLRLLDDSGWQSVDTGRDGIHGPQSTLVSAALKRIAERVPFISPEQIGPPSYVDRAIEEVVTALDEGREPELSGANALQATELIFACWESSRQQGRVDLPLEIGDNPLESMVENGDVLVSTN
jgi:predicted dehydrogenase